MKEILCPASWSGDIPVSFTKLKIGEYLRRRYIKQETVFDKCIVKAVEEGKADHIVGICSLCISHINAGRGEGDDLHYY